MHQKVSWTDTRTHARTKPICSVNFFEAGGITRYSGCEISNNSYVGNRGGGAGGQSGEWDDGLKRGMFNSFNCRYLGNPFEHIFLMNGFRIEKWQYTLDDEFHIGPKSGEKYTHLSKGWNWSHIEAWHIYFLFPGVGMSEQCSIIL